MFKLDEAQVAFAKRIKGDFEDTSCYDPEYNGEQKLIDNFLYLDIYGNNREILKGDNIADLNKARGVDNGKGVRSIGEIYTAPQHGSAVRNATHCCKFAKSKYMKGCESKVSSAEPSVGASYWPEKDFYITILKTDGETFSTIPASHENEFYTFTSNIPDKINSSVIYGDVLGSAKYKTNTNIEKSINIW